LEERVDSGSTSWKTILLPPLVTSAVTVLAGLAIAELQAREPELVYYVDEARPFNSVIGNVCIYDVQIGNSGTETVKEVICSVDLGPLAIPESAVDTDRAMQYEETVESGVYRIRVPHLNPHDRIGLSLYVTSSGELPNKPEVSLRGVGYTGMEGSNIELGVWLANLAASAALVAAVVAAISSRTYRKAIETIMGRLGMTTGSDQRHVLSYLLGIHGFHSEAAELVKAPVATTYWIQSDKLTSAALDRPDVDGVRRARQVLCALLSYAPLGDSSRGIVHYNISRLSRKLEDTQAQANHMVEARKYTGELVEKRLSVDPAFTQPDS